MADPSFPDYPHVANWKPGIPIVRQPDYNAYSINNVVPTPTLSWTTYTWPTKPAVPTINWQTGAASLSSELSSFFSSYTEQKNPAAATQSSNWLTKSKKGNGLVVGIVSAVAAAALVCIVAGVVLFKCRQRRQKRMVEAQQALSREMAQSGRVAETRAYIRPPSVQPTSASHSPASTSPLVAQQSHLPQPPVLLSTTMDQSYFTGIDTSDNLSIADSHRLSVASPPYTSSMLDAPPPPYRPRSVVSRNNSLRYSAPPPSYGPRLSVRSTNMNIVTSPFDDPEDEEHSSDLNAPPSPLESSSNQVTIRDMEEMSDVSELSYQEEEPSEGSSTPHTSTT